MRSFCVALLLLAASPLSSAFAKESPEPDPIAWGMLSRNSGCVIFAEGHHTSGMFWGVAVTTKTIGKLTVIETQNSTIDPKEYLETQEVMNDLMRRAQQDNLKYVKIREKYSPELLEKARAMCRSGEQQ